MSENQKQPVRLTVKQILSDLDSGLTRAEIGTKYGLTGADVTRLFKHPDLKGKKTKTPPGFIIVDEYEEYDDTAQADTIDTQEETVETSNSLF